MNSTQHMLEHKAYTMRRWSLIQTTEAGSGHPTTCLSAADIVSALFFYAMRYDPHNPKNPDNDRFVLSKGHASALLYAAWQQAGVLTDGDLMTHRHIDSPLEGHPTFRFAHTEAATGSLGMGLSVGVGMALTAKMDKRAYITYVLLGDSEMAEGSVWEAVQSAAHYKLNNLVGIIDCNRLGQSEQTMLGHDVDGYAQRLQAFGWRTLVVEGHDMAALMQVCDAAREKSDTPIMIIAKTLKGYGLKSIEDQNGFHGKPIARDELEKTLHQIEKRFPNASAYDGPAWQPQLPEKKAPAEAAQVGSLPTPDHTLGEMIPTRKAFGLALKTLGGVADNVVVFDAEVKNSTHTHFFEEVYPDRFVQSFIAEQNMVSMAVGAALRGKIPFVATFACFLTRAHDQLRMAPLSGVALRVAGSHAGVSIGQDGPSQMGLEDIGMMRALPHACVLYPSDAISAYKLVEQMAQYDTGISYMRTTRAATPILYGNDETFPIGGCKVLKQSSADVACIVAAGITLHEALKAYDTLKSEYNKTIAIIDLYSIKPIDATTLMKVGKAAGNTIITVEDHYPEGGIGEAVMHACVNSGITIHSLAVIELPRSGKPEKLLAWAGIDANAIIKKVLSF